MLCSDCGRVHNEGFCWSCNTPTGPILEHVSYDCQRDELFEIVHTGDRWHRVICANCLPSLYHDRRKAKVNAYVISLKS